MPNIASNSKAMEIVKNAKIERYKKHSWVSIIIMIISPIIVFEAKIKLTWIVFDGKAHVNETDRLNCFLYKDEKVRRSKSSELNETVKDRQLFQLFKY